MATGGLYGYSTTGALVAAPGSESSGLYGSNNNFSTTYFEWFIFKESATAPATPTGGSWNFVTNVGIAPTGWSSTPPVSPVNTVWASITIVNSRSTDALTWTAPASWVKFGPAATIAVGTTTTGAPGTSASVNNSGTSNAAVFNFQIPRGDVGATGSTGATGSAATITAGTTTTLSPGASATVTNSGTSSAAIFNFGIPQGTTGATGAGVAAGGTTNQVLVKTSNTDYATSWVTSVAQATYATSAGAVPYSGLTGTVPTWNQSTTGTAANITATSNATLTTLSALSLPYSQLSGTVPTWNQSTTGNAANVTGIVAVANGGTGVTVSSGANSVVLRDANQNIAANAFDESYTNIAASGTQITLTVASARRYTITGSGGQVIKLPDATTLQSGAVFLFDNNQSSGAITVNNNSNTLIVSVPSGGFVAVNLLSNASAAGSWDRHDQAPANVSWSTNTFDYPGSITSATWNGVAVAINRGGTGASTKATAFNALSPMSAAGDVIYGGTSGAGTALAIGTAGQVLTVNSGATAPQWSTPTTGTVTSVSGTGTVNGLSLSGTVTSSGNLTFGGTLDLSSPPAIGSTAASTGAFTTLSASSTVSGTGFSTYLASPPDIGGTAAAAGTFTTLTAATTNIQAAGANAGLTMLRNSDSGTNSTRIFLDSSSGVSTIYNSSNSILFNTSAVIGTTSGVNQFRVAPTTSAVNYVQVTGAVTGGNPSIVSAGSDGAINLALSSKSTSSIFFYTNNLSANSRHLDITHTGTVVNRFQLTGAQTGFGVTLGVNGSDTNISQVFQSKGTGAIDLVAGSSGVNISNGGTVTAITRTAAGSSYTSIPSVAITAPTTAGGVQATATVAMLALGTATVVGGGTGYTNGDILTPVGGTGGTATRITVSAVSGGVITAASVSANSGYTVLPTNPVSVTGGTGSGATFNLVYAIDSTFTITNAGSGYVEQPTVTFSGGGGSGAAAYATVGGTAVIKGLGATGIATIDFQTPQSITASVPAMRIRDNVSDSYPMINNTTNQANFVAQGFANSGFGIAAAGTGNVRFYTNGTSLTQQMQVSHTASAVNYVQVTGGATGGAPTISLQGSDAAVGLTFNTKSTGVYTFQTNGTTRLLVNSGGTVQLGYANATPCFTAAGVASQVNGFQVSGSIAGSAPSLSSTGTDADIDITLTPKGAGAIRFGTYTGTILTPTGYITIKDSGGTTRRLLVG